MHFVRLVDLQMSNLSDVELSRLLPQILQGDIFCCVLAESFGKQVRELEEESDKLSNFENYDDMPEEMLDYLAFQKHVDFYDVELDIEVKREILRNNTLLHRKKGTKQAVINAASTIFGKTTLNEWFEYDGEPFGFTMDVDISEIGASQENKEKLEKLVMGYKNARSWVEKINFKTSVRGNMYLGGVVSSNEKTTIYPQDIMLEITNKISLGSCFKFKEHVQIYPKGSESFE